MPFDYEQRYREAYAENVLRIAETLESGKIDRKIENFCEIHGFSVDELRTEIVQNKFLAAVFALNPNKQNFYETVAAEYIKELPYVHNFENLPSSALYIINGKLLSREEAKGITRQNRSTKRDHKTIDFSWTCNCARFYAAHKYTKQEGGAQTNQYHDLQTFVRESVSNSDDKVHFVAIADGPFYENRNGLAGTTRIERLRALAGGSERVHVCRLDEIESLLLSIIAQP
ncbi:MAG: hypothetical protein OXU88_00430 [Gammaproteobacteria bacterium]|nr:hypothetical protein [Gammaproteobacteria bacterium]